MPAIAGQGRSRSSIEFRGLHVSEQVYMGKEAVSCRCRNVMLHALHDHPAELV